MMRQDLTLRRFPALTFVLKAEAELLAALEEIGGDVDLEALGLGFEELAAEADMPPAPEPTED